MIELTPKKNKKKQRKVLESIVLSAVNKLRLIQFLNESFQKQNYSPVNLLF